MLDTNHQAAGLAALAAQATARVGAVVCHGDRRSELPLMWQLCSTWQALDYTVVVLDATVQETEARPGLQQQMESDEPEAVEPGAQDWPILPAALGLAALRREQPDSATRLRRLSELFHGYDLVLLYAPAPELSATLPATALSPLLPVSTGETALVTAYQALKQLLNPGRLRPTIVAVMDDTAVASRVSGHSISRNLQDCARDFLACEVPALTVCPAQTGEMQRLALRTLECALQAAPWAPVPAQPASPRAARSL